jgi:transcriptional regulator of acetoin/glycerol metabolism
MVFDLIFAVVFALYYLRELEHVMEHALVLCQGATITLSNLPAYIKELRKL